MAKTKPLMWHVLAHTIARFFGRGQAASSVDGKMENKELRGQVMMYGEEAEEA